MTSMPRKPRLLSSPFPCLTLSLLVSCAGCDRSEAVQDRTSIRTMLVPGNKLKDANGPLRVDDPQFQPRQQAGTRSITLDFRARPEGGTDNQPMHTTGKDAQPGHSQGPACKLRDDYEFYAKEGGLFVVRKGGPQDKRHVVHLYLDDGAEVQVETLHSAHNLATKFADPDAYVVLDVTTKAKPTGPSKRELWHAEVKKVENCLNARPQ